jgi:hypothetical protein
MAQPLSVAPLPALFRFPFQGPDWKKRFLIGSALMLANLIIPILPLIVVAGYVIEVMRRILRGEDPALPPWSDWGRLTIDGLRGALVSLVFLLPGTVVYLIGMGLYLLGIVVAPLAVGTSGRSPAAMAVFLGLAAAGVLMFFTCIAIVLWLVGSAPLPAATAHFVVRDRVGAAFSVGEWWPILRANAMGFFIDWVLVAGLWALAYLACALVGYTVVLCCLLPLVAAPALFYLWVVGAAKFALSYREGAALVTARGRA